MMDEPTMTRPVLGNHPSWKAGSSAVLREDNHSRWILMSPSTMIVQINRIFHDFVFLKSSFTCSRFHDIVNGEHQKWSDIWKERIRFTGDRIKSHVNPAIFHPEIMMLRSSKPQADHCFQLQEVLSNLNFIPNQHNQKAVTSLWFVQIFQLPVYDSSKFFS